MKKERIRLIYPPLSVHEFPHMALPQLKGYLNNVGYRDVKIYDFNVGIMKEIIWSRLYKVSQHYENRGIDISLKQVERNFGLAKNYLYDERDRGKDEWAIAMLNAYHKIAGANISDICYSPKSFSEIVNRHIECVTDTITRLLDNKIEEVLIDAPDIVGITVPFASQLYYAFYIGQVIKARAPKVKIVLGGSQVSLFWKIISSYEVLMNSFDNLLCGEGELGLTHYVEYINGNIQADEVEGLVYYSENGELRKNEEKIVTQECEMIVPNFDDYDLMDYVYPKLPYMMNKGCYWSQCAFCSYRNEYPFVKKSVNKIISDIKDLKEKHRIRFIHFIDDAFPPDVMRNFSEEIINNNIRIKYENYLRLDKKFDNSLCRLMARSGLRSALFGLESANLRILRLMRKGIDPNIALYVLKNMTSANIKTVVSCMIGFPSETCEEAMETIDFLKAHKSIISQAYLVRFGLISDMKDFASEYGIYDVNEKDIVRYDVAGFVALGYSYKTCSGMNDKEILRIINYGRECFEGQVPIDCFFS